MQFITQHHPEMLPEGKMVPMWIKGQQTELFMIGFEIIDEPMDIEDVPLEVLEKNEILYDLLLDDNLVDAKLLAQELIGEAPDFPSAYNQLAVVYERQGQREKARELLEKTYTRFPDYFFSRVALARMMIAEKRVEEAMDLVNPLMRRTKLHYSEFQALARMQMEISLAKKSNEGARMWLEMWQQIEPDNPELLEWEIRINGPNLLQKLQNLIR